MAELNNIPFARYDGRKWMIVLIDETESYETESYPTENEVIQINQIIISRNLPFPYAKTRDAFMREQQNEWMSNPLFGHPIRITNPIINFNQ